MTDYFFRVGTLQRFFLTVIVLSVTLSHQTCHGSSDESEMVKLVAAVNDFAFNFYRQLIIGNQNSFIVSPYSAAVALSMLLMGARTKTAAEISKTLGYQAVRLTPGQVQAVYQKLLSNENESKDVDLSVANSIWMQSADKILPNYKSIIENSFLAQAEEVDFRNQSTIDEINNWVSNATNGKVTNVLSEVDPDSLFILINAVYFKGQWDNSFNKSRTMETDFHNAFSNSVKKVPMMRRNGKYSNTFSELLEAQILEIPYVGKEYSMIIILPQNRSGLKETENKLSADAIKYNLQSTYKSDVDVSLPRFNLSSSLELKQVLQSLGIEKAFMEGADFSGISQTRSLFVSSVFQKAICEVNEEGTVAAAATAIRVSSRQLEDEEIPFNVDHPFLFIIQNMKSGLILFMGRVFEM